MIPYAIPSQQNIINALVEWEALLIKFIFVFEAFQFSKSVLLRSNYIIIIIIIIT